VTRGNSSHNERRAGRGADWPPHEIPAAAARDEAARPAMRELFQKNEDANRKALQTGRIADLFMLSADDQDLARGAGRPSAGW
jgi:hypothetical protein